MSKEEAIYIDSAFKLHGTYDPPFLYLVFI